MDAQNLDLAIASLNKTASKVLAHIAKMNGATHANITAQDTNISRATAIKYINEPAAVGLVEVRFFSNKPSITLMKVPSDALLREGETTRTPGPNWYTVSLSDAEQTRRRADASFASNLARA